MIATGCAAAIFGIRSSEDFRVLVLPQITTTEIIVSAVFVALALTLPYLMRHTWVALLPIVCFTAFSIQSVWPLQHGTGTMVHSPIAQQIQLAADDGGGRWASDGVIIDSLLLASGVPQLSGQQSNGPNRESWRLMDPTEAHIDNWNRGASYVTFAWNDEATPVIANSSQDVIQVTVSPCAPSMTELKLEWILTSNTLDQPCVTLFGSGMWQGQTLNIYKVTR